MYTQCPKCQTVFHISMEQLQARNGLVRCGQCDNVFNADQQLFGEVPAPQPESSAPPTRKTRGANKKTKSSKTKTTATRPAAEKNNTLKETTEKVETAPPPWSPSNERRGDIQSIPIPAENLQIAYSEKTFTRPASRRFSFLWLLGDMLLIATLAAQLIYFYRDQLAAYPELKPFLLDMCEELNCTLQPPYDINRIELIQPTNIAPHPRIANALRLRATLVNRSNKLQPLPLMQITLTDNAGRVLSRRSFAPNQYIEQRSNAATDMAPHLAINALLDLTNPDGKAVGYQIDFVAPSIDVPVSR